MDEATTIALNCPSCGAGIRVKENDRTVECSYCGAEHFLSGIEGTVRSIVRFGLSAGEAKKRVLRYFRRRDTAQDIPIQGQLREITAIYVPFWRVREGYAGWRFRQGYRAQLLKRRAEVTVPGCSTGGLGLTLARIEPEDLDTQELYEPVKAQREATVYDVTIPKEDVLQLTRKRVLGMTKGKGSSSIFSQRVKRVSTTASLIYLPFWLIKYSYKGKFYQVVVDGRRGTIVSGRFPANLAARLAPLIAASALGGFLATTFVSAKGIWESEPLVGPVFAIIIATVIIAGFAGFLQLFQSGLAALRYGREVRIEDARRVDALPEYEGMVGEFRQSLRELAGDVYQGMRTVDESFKEYTY